jgi:hypothetical protein
MNPKLLNDGYKPTRSDPVNEQRGYQPTSGHSNPPPPPPPHTGSSVVKPQE